MAIQHVEAGCDWLQVTYPEESLVAQPFRTIFAAQKRVEEANGMLPHFAQIHGYDGLSVGGVALLHNKRSHRWLFKTSSKLADDTFDAVSTSAIHADCTITRLDLQVTVWYTNYEGGLAEAIADRISEFERRRNKATPLYMKGFGKGDTLYFGRPSSERRLRMYDKYQETGGDAQYLNAWRYEVQYRQSYARTALKRVMENPPAPESIAQIVQSEFMEHNINVVPDVRIVQRIESWRRDTDYDRRLKWLQYNVAPAVRDLALRYGWQPIFDILKGDL